MINLLWTGGWDSTYRLLYLIIVENQHVQPYYLIDPDRKSTKEEMAAMNDIRKLLRKKDQLLSELLFSTKIVKVQSLNDHQEISDKYMSLKSRFHIGSQYEWLAKFAHEYQIKNLEIGIEKDVIDRSPFFKYLSEFMQIEGKTISLSKKLPDFNLSFLQDFHFPVFFLTKLDMKYNAKHYGFYDILKKTWFCHTPKNGKPCGWCNPCKAIMISDVKDRMPLYGKARYYLYRMIKNK